jgi:hypothetical protein
MHVSLSVRDTFNFASVAARISDCFFTPIVGSFQQDFPTVCSQGKCELWWIYLVHPRRRPIRKH